jgi:ACS family hexuronate transporter-like MFS transporter
MLLGITIVNFIDRQTLSVLAPHIKQLFHFTNTQYGRIVASFQFGMMSSEFPMGMLMDRWGVRTGFTFAVLSWSAATGAHVFASNLWQFAGFRFWMGTGECGNFSGGVKVVTEWFPKRDRALAIGIFNSGSMIGSMIAPPLIVLLNHLWGWKVAFLVPATLGVGWVLLWRAIYRPAPAASEPDSAGAASPDSAAEAMPGTWQLLRYRQSWALMLCRFLASPVVQFYWYWMPDYLFNVRGMSLRDIGAFSWVPYLIGDVGSIAGGWAAARLIANHFSVLRARKLTMFFGAVCCLGSLLVVGAHSSASAIGIIGLVMFGHTFMSANMFASIGDLFPERLAGRVTGLTGFSGGLSGILFPLMTGILVDRYGYAPVFLIAAALPLAGVSALFLIAPGHKPALKGI